MGENEPIQNEHTKNPKLKNFGEILEKKEKALQKLKDLEETFLAEVNNNPKLSGYKRQEELIHSIFSVWKEEIQKGRTKPYSYDDIVRLINQAAKNLPFYSPTKNIIKIAKDEEIEKQVADTLTYNKKLSKIYWEMNWYIEKSKEEEKIPKP